jgi:hypothetical protein
VSQPILLRHWRGDGRAFGVALLSDGASSIAHRRQAREAKGFAASDFRIDRDREQVTCPAGRTSASWTPARDSRGRAVIKIKFARGTAAPAGIAWTARAHALPGGR